MKEDIVQYVDVIVPGVQGAVLASIGGKFGSIEFVPYRH